MIVESPSVLARAGRGFARELKFVAGDAQAEIITAWAREHLECDPHAGGDGYGVVSIYYDTPEFDVYRRRGSYARSKYRIRRYSGCEDVFLERKLKRGHRVGKIRSSIPAGELPRLDEPEPVRGWAGAWFHGRIAARGLHPVCQLEYRRMARVLSTAEGPIRLTLDRGLRALPVESAAFAAAEGIEVLPDRYVLELKFFGQLPALFRDLAQTAGVAPAAFSKYRTAAVALGLIDA